MYLPPHLQYYSCNNFMTALQMQFSILCFDLKFNQNTAKEKYSVKYK